MSTDDPCTSGPTDDRKYQEQARGLLAHEGGRHIPALVRVVWRCDTAWCLTPSHLDQVEPVRLSYPYGVCVYCGQPGSTRDHILPRAWTGEASRQFTVTVPSCGECNSLIGESVADTIAERREIAQGRIRKKYHRILSHYEYTPAEIDEFGPGLRESVIRGLADKAHISARLEWPTDPFYDARAFDKSGVYDLDPFPEPMEAP